MQALEKMVAERRKIIRNSFLPNQFDKKARPFANVLPPISSRPN